MNKAGCLVWHALHIVAALALMLFLCSTQMLAAPPGDPSDWVMTFQDEFSGTIIDTSVWRTQYYWGRTNGAGLEWNLDENVVVSGGTLKLVTRKESPQGSACFGVPCTYSAGTIQSKVFNQTYGYFEASMKLPAGAGFLPAFWLLPEGAEHWEMPEVDIMEQFTSHGQHEIQFSHYWGKNDPEPAVGDENRGGGQSNTYIGVPDYSAGFHVYGAEWDSDKIVFYVDDAERYRVTNHIPQAGYFTGMYLLFTLVVGGTKVGDPDLNTAFPNQLEIDYVRVYDTSANWHTLTVSRSGTGAGTVTGAGISCGPDCAERYVSGTVVTLTATLDTGSVFGGWSGGGCSGTGTCTVTMNTNVTVIATFNLLGPSPMLTVTKSGNGTGRIASDPVGIDCGTDCIEPYPGGQSVNLEAAADPGSIFGGWSGGGCSGPGMCVVTMNTNTTINGTFNLLGSLSVNEGTIGTQITIPSSGFGMKKGKVLIGDATTKILSWSGSAITFEVKKPLQPGLYDVVVQPKEPKGVAPITYSEAFTMMEPEILSVPPILGLPGEEIELPGSYFGIKRGKVYLSGKNCKIRLWIMDAGTGESHITFVVPKNMALGDYDITVTNKVGSDTFVAGFTVLP